MDIATIESLIIMAIEFGTPLLLASLGEIYAERSGILNLGVEGIICVGAVIAFITAYHTKSLFLAFLMAAIIGAILASIHAFVCVYMRGNQIISGLALTMIGLGLGSLLGRDYVGIRLGIVVYPVYIPLLSDIPIIGAFFKQDPIVYFTYILAIALWFILFKTRIGLEIRAVGESPISADTAGIDVNRIRFLSTIFGGAMAGMAGAYISTVIMKMWIEKLTLGKGWIALALVILALWNPILALVFSYLFGFIDVLRIHLMAYGFNPYLLGMIPYVTSIIVLALAVIILSNKGFIGPSALGKPYVREEEALHG